MQLGDADDYFDDPHVPRISDGLDRAVGRLQELIDELKKVAQLESIATFEAFADEINCAIGAVALQMGLAERRNRPWSGPLQ